MVSSGPELDLEFLTTRKDNIEMPKGTNTPMCFCGDNCKLVRCKVLGYAYGMRFFMCANYAHDPIQHFDRNLKVKTPPPLCDFMQWINTEQSEFDKSYVEKGGRDARERWFRMVEWEKREEKKRRRRKCAFVRR